MNTINDNDSIFFADEPIRTLEEDTLNRKGFVERLTTSILKWNLTDCLVMGLCGPWGSGKTSILHMVQDEISKEENDIHVEFFDPWYFSSQEKLIRNFFLTLNKALESFLDPSEKYKLGNLFRKYAKKISISVDPELTLFSIIKLRLSTWALWKDEDPAKIREEIRQELRRLDRKILIVIDNIDRLDANELLLILKLVRLCSDFPNLIFILAFDRNRVIEQIKGEKIPPDFLSKIIQVEIQLPIIGKNEIDFFVSMQLERILNDLQIYIDQGTKDIFYKSIYRTIIENVIKDMRSAKRYLNGLSFNLPMVFREVNFIDFLVIEVLRIFYFYVYDQLQKYRIPLTNIPLERGNSNPFENLRKMIAENYGGEEETIDKLLSYIFPNYNFHFKFHYPSHTTSINMIEKDLNISSRRHFDKYFTFQVPTGDIPRRNVIELIQKVNDPNIDLNEIQKEMEIYTGYDNTLSPIYQEIRLVSEVFTEDGKERMILVLLQLIKITKGTDEFPETGEIIDWEELILGLLTSLGKNGEKLLIDVIKNISLLLVTRLIYRGIYKKLIHGEKNPEAWKVIREHFLSRIENEIKPLGSGIFDNYMKSYYAIINLWRSDYIGEKESATEYLFSLLEKDPQKLPALLEPYVLFTVGDEHLEGYEFNELENTYDIQRILAIAKQIDVEKIENKKQKYAITRVIGHYPDAPKPEKS